MIIDSSRNRRSFGLVMMGLAIVLVFFFRFGLHYVAKPEVFLNDIQNSVIAVEHRMHSCVANPINYEQYDDLDLGVIVYDEDSLVYWNSNVVGPKLLRRRVPLQCDTICNLLSGDYLVSSFAEGRKSFYVFKLLKTNYSIENEYFENRFWLFPFVVDVNIRFDAKSQIGYPIYDEQNEVLTYCEVTANPTVKPVYWRSIGILVGCLFLLGLVLLVSSFLSVQLAFSHFRRKDHPYALEVCVTVVLLLAVFFTYLYSHHQVRKENQNMIETAHRLSDKRDPEFEKSFLQFQNKLQNDSTLREMIFGESNVLADVVLGYSEELLFDDNMKSYQPSLTLCSPGVGFTVQSDSVVTDCETYFADILANNRNEEVGDGLYFIDYYTLDPNYLGMVTISSLDSLMTRTLYFEFYKPVVPEGFGFPKMLQDCNALIFDDLSVANYRDTLLVYKNGRYMFPSFLNDLKVENGQFKYEKSDKLYARKYGDNSTLIICVPRKGWSEATAPFGVIFLALLIPALLICLLLRTKPTHKQSSLSRKLRALVLWTLLISFFVVGPISVIYMRSLYNKKTTTSQFETIRTLSLEMQNDLDFERLINLDSRETWTEILHNYSSTFFTDLNLYGTDGRLVATTREEVYDHFLQAPLMNAEAFRHMNVNKALYYIHEEKLGKAVYESAYVPIIDLDGNTLAYLNTPFFSSKADLHREILNFVLTYLNIILLLFGLALLFVMGITRRLTQPLGLIQNKMRDVKIDRPNETIEWQSNDEIGALINQYNQLVVKLEQSAAELQRTTTESAWRGVARQVAHEIKNSLTPMRLSVQMLQRAVDNGAENLDERFKRTSDMLIEQIDALSDMASSFSNYAKLPENDPKPLDLAELVGNVVNLYDNTENISFTYSYDKNQDHTFVGDKTNLNSAVSNIIKNAVQAIGSKPDGKITVSLIASEQKFLISIKDNGRGIKEEDKKQVFLPNFTTKTNGSGVGLSLTYNIIQSAGGRITFESQEGEGTEFVIELFKKDSLQ